MSKTPSGMRKGPNGWVSDYLDSADDGREWRTVSSVIDGEPMFSALGLSILTGWDEADFTAGPAPASALRDGRRRVSEASAWVGSRDIGEILPFLASKMGYDLVSHSPYEVIAAKRKRVSGGDSLRERLNRSR